MHIDGSGAEGQLLGDLARAFAPAGDFGDLTLSAGQDRQPLGELGGRNDRGCRHTPCGFPAEGAGATTSGQLDGEPPAVLGLGAGLAGRLGHERERLHVGHPGHREQPGRPVVERAGSVVFSSV